MDKTTFYGVSSLIGGMTLYFISGTFILTSDFLGIAFQVLGIVLIYVGIALVMWNVLGSLNLFLEKLVKRS
jgi:hypothetical protein